MPASLRKQKERCCKPDSTVSLLQRPEPQSRGGDLRLNFSDAGGNGAAYLLKYRGWLKSQKQLSEKHTIAKHPVEKTRKAHFRER